jgi:hypothetical protein
MAAQNRHKIQQEKERIKQIAYNTFGREVILSQWISMLTIIEKSCLADKIRNQYEK